MGGSILHKPLHKLSRLNVILATLLVFILTGSAVLHVLAVSTSALQPISCPFTGGTLIVIHWGDPKSFNPDSQVDDALYAIASNLFNKLVTLDVNYNVIPDLAERWEISPDGKVFKFYLVKGVKWHDGVPFTARDVKYTFEAIKRYNGIAYGLLRMDKLESIEVIDDYTVVFKYSEPFPAFLGFLAWYGTFILPEHIYNKSEYKDWMDPNIPALTSPIGTGPFKFKEYVKGSHIILEANENYFKGRPCLDRVVYRIITDPVAATQAFLAGEGDVLGVRPPTTEIPKLNATPGVKVETRPLPSRWYIAFNLLDPLLADLRLRLAIAHAINRAELVEKAESGYAYEAKGTYPPAIAWAHNPNVKLPEYNPAKAEAILDELGYRKGPDGYRYLPDGRRLSFRFTVFTGAETEAIASIIKEQLRAIGIEIKVEVLEIAAWEDKVVKRRDFDIAMLDGFQGPDPDNMRIRFAPGAYINMANYSNMEFKEILERAASEPDMEKRRELYWKAQEILARDLPYLPLVDLMAFFIYKTDYTGFYWQLPGVVGINSLERVYWLKGKPATPLTTPTEATPTTATTPEKAEGRPTTLYALAVAVLAAIVILAAALVLLRRRS